MYIEIFPLFIFFKEKLTAGAVSYETEISSIPMSTSVNFHKTVSFVNRIPLRSVSIYSRYFGIKNTSAKNICISVIFCFKDGRDGSGGYVSFDSADRGKHKSMFVLFFKRVREAAPGPVSRVVMFSQSQEQPLNANLSAYLYFEGILLIPKLCTRYELLTVTRGNSTRSPTHTHRAWSPRSA